MNASEHAEGALLGLAIGDALGTTLEFSKPPPQPFEPPLREPVSDIVGGGPFELEPGHVTDDTQMAVCLAGSLLERREFDPVDCARRYVEWSSVAFDIGSQTRAALAAVGEFASPVAAGRAVWERGGRKAAGNGSLMRTAPIAVWFAGSDAQRRRAAMLDSTITHFDPRCTLACAAFDAAIAAALSPAGGADARSMSNAASRELDAALQFATRELEVEPQLAAAAHADLARDLDTAQRDDPELYGTEVHLTEHMGFVRVAFRAAFWSLLHARDFESGLLNLVNRGGDSDTNGAIAGALLGARFGRAGIPARWIASVLAPKSSRPSSRYHPRTLLELGAGRV